MKMIGGNVKVVDSPEEKQWYVRIYSALACCRIKMGCIVTMYNKEQVLVWTSQQEIHAVHVSIDIFI